METKDINPTTAKHRERAREIVLKYLRGKPAFVLDAFAEMIDEIAATEAAAHAEGREEMREEAAKECDKWIECYRITKGPYAVAANAARKCAETIRALPKDTGNG